MDEELLHRLFRRLIKSADYYSDVLVVFGEDSSQARQARDRYNECFDAWKRENHWERFCSIEGPWQPECRVYDC